MKNGCAKSTSMKAFQPIKLPPLLGATQSASMKNSETSEYRQEAAQIRFKQTLGGLLESLQEQDGSILPRRNASCATKQLGAPGLLAKRIRCLAREASKRRIGRVGQRRSDRRCIQPQSGKHLSNTSMRETNTHVRGAEAGITDQTSYMPTTLNHGQNIKNYEPIQTT